MKIELSQSTLGWQAKAREYADEYLQPHEVEAELNGGVLPEEISKRNKARAIELGFSAIDVPKKWGGLREHCDARTSGNAFRNPFIVRRNPLIKRRGLLVCIRS